MKIGFVGLGKMGFLLAKQLHDAGNEVVAWDLDQSQTQKFANAGGTIVGNFQEMAEALNGKKIIWLMVPAGDAVESVINELVPNLGQGDIIIDGGNSYFKDSQRRFNDLAKKGIHFIDCGTSGGLEGAADGACLMVGGESESVQICEPIFTTLTMEGGYLHCGGPGSGHFIKMVHNGIEYGMMQAIAEGFEMINHSSFDVNMKDVARLWSRGSVIRGWLMDLTGNALEKDPNLDKIKGIMHHSGEGKWTAQTALEMEIPAPVITQSLQVRFRSKQDDTFSGKVVAALRNEFGGHQTESSGSD